jgi:hypothetical protein
VHERHVVDRGGVGEGHVPGSKIAGFFLRMGMSGG